MTTQDPYLPPGVTQCEVDRRFYAPDEEWCDDCGSLLYDDGTCPDCDCETTA